MPKQYDKEDWPLMKQKFRNIFLQRTQDEWAAIFVGSDACVTPVLSFQDNAPQPAPILSRTPAQLVQSPTFLQPGKHSIEVLKEFGISSNEIQLLLSTQALKNNASL